MIPSPAGRSAVKRLSKSSIKSWRTNRAAKIVVLAPLIENQPGEFRDVLEKLRREGFVRARIDGQMIELDRTEPIRLKKGERHTIEAVVDRLVVRDGIRVRLTDSIETALKWGGNRIVVLCQTSKTPNPVKAETGQAAQRPTSNAESEEWAECRYSTDYGNAETGFNLGELTPRHFSFQQPPRRLPSLPRSGNTIGSRSGTDDLRPNRKRWPKEQSHHGVAAQNACESTIVICRMR